MDGRQARISKSVEDRFWSKVNKTDTCWLWETGKTSRGYGSFWFAPNKLQAHRVSYVWANGPIPEGLLVDHICRVKACVNPAHLRLATQKQNLENLSGPNRNSTSGIRGVTWNKKAGKWRARVGHKGKLLELGYFDLIEDAENAAKAKRLEVFTHCNN